MITPEISNPMITHEFNKIPEAIVKGFWKSLKGTINTLQHPIDNIVYPVGRFVYDAHIIAAKFNPECDLHHIIKSNPEIYTKSKENMNNIFLNIKEGCNEFVNEDFYSKLAKVSELSFDVLIPGTVIKSMKQLNNYSKFRTLNKPSKFETTVATDLSNLKSSEINTLFINDIRKINSGKLMYVYTEDQKLIMCHPDHHSLIKRNKGTKEIFTFDIKHPELADLKKIHAAGEIIIENGRIISIDNNSGHFVPRNINSKFIEKVFRDNGYLEASGKYSEIPLKPNRTRYPKEIKQPTKTPIIPNVFNKSEKEQGIVTGGINSLDLEDPSELDYIDKAEYDFTLCSDSYIVEPDDVKNIIYTLKESHDKYKSSFEKEDLLEFNNSLHQIASLGVGLSQFALLAGGHQRTWRNIGVSCHGMMSICSGAFAIMAGKSFLSMAGGYIGVGIGVLTVLAGLIGGGDDDSLEQLANAIQGMLTQMLNTIMDALQTIHKTIVDGFAMINNLIVYSVMPRLLDINRKMDRLENIICLSFKELHKKNLIDVLDNLQKNIVKEHKLSTIDRDKYIRKLSTWIDQHSKSTIQTYITRITSDDAKSVEILNNFSDPLECLPFLLVEISKITNLHIDITQIPNVPVFLIATDMYISCVSTYNVNTLILDRVKDVLRYLQKVIDSLRDKRDIIIRQYTHYKFLVGRQIEKCRNEYTNDSSPLYKFLKSGPEYEHLSKLLDKMDLHRVIVLHIDKLLNLKSIPLKSKQDILGMTNLKSTVNILIHDTNLLTIERISDSLDIGCSINHSDDWGSIINYLAKNQSDPRVLHLILKDLNIDINKPAKKDLGDGLGPNVRPILHMLNSGKFHCGLLLCAQGRTIDEKQSTGQPLLTHYIRRFDGAYISTHTYNSTPFWGWGHKDHHYIPQYDTYHHFYTTDLGHCHKYNGTTNGYNYSPHHLLCISLAKETNTPNSEFYRDNLRKAYTYYKNVQDGFDNNSTIGADINIQCLLLLTCIVGDLYPLIYSGYDIKDIVNEPIEVYGLTYLMVACYSSNMDVIRYLIRNGANIDSKTNLKNLITARDFAGDCGKKILDGVDEYDNLDIFNPQLFTEIIQRIDSLKFIKGNNDDSDLMNKRFDLLIRLVKKNIDKLGEDDKLSVLEDLKLIEEHKNNEYLRNIQIIFELYDIHSVSNKISDYLN